MIAAWELLVKMGFNKGDYLYPEPNPALSPPSFSKDLRVNTLRYKYNPATWLTVWDLAVQKANKEDDLQIHDQVLITASVLFRHATYLHFRCAHAFEEKDKTDLNHFAQRFITILLETDTLLYNSKAGLEVSKLHSLKGKHGGIHCLAEIYVPSWKHFFNAAIEKIKGVPLNDHEAPGKPTDAATSVNTLYNKYRDGRMSCLE